MAVLIYFADFPWTSSNLFIPASFIYEILHRKCFHCHQTWGKVGIIGMRFDARIYMEAPAGIPEFLSFYKNVKSFQSPHQGLVVLRTRLKFKWDGAFAICAWKLRNSLSLDIRPIKQAQPFLFHSFNSLMIYELCSCFHGHNVCLLPFSVEALCNLN